MPTLSEVERMATDRAVQAVNANLPAQWGLRRPPVATFSTIPGSRVNPVIDPDTGFPVEPDEEEDGLFLPGDVPGSGKVLS